MVCLPLAPQDKDHGIELLRLWADLEDSFNSTISIAICVRFDIDIDRDIGREVIEYASKKFKIYTHVSRRRVTGWPAGCNGLELDAYEWFVESNRSGHYDFEYILFAEADTLPTRKGWAIEIMNEAYDNKSVILGCMLMMGDCGVEHINGNCVIHRDYWKKCKTIFNSPSRIGWDAWIGPSSIANGTASRLIWQDYRLGLPDNPWRGDDYLFEERFYKSQRSPFYGKPIRPAMIHGVKVLDGIRAIRKKFQLTA